jgi:hypothetical protein
MKLPFTTEEFLKVFETYNQAVFPMQLILYLLALLIIYLCIKKKSWSDKTISAMLSFLWLWMGMVYHIIFFTAINKVAYFFGTLFILQGGLFLWKGVFQNKLKFNFTKNMYGLVGIVLMVFALIIYPIIGYAFGHVYPVSPTFGLPCPTTLFTFGMLLLLNGKYPKLILIIPFIWAIIGFSAALSLGIKEDISLLISAIIVLGLLIGRNRKINALNKKP